MFLRCSYFLAKSEADVLINSVLIKRKACIFSMSFNGKFAFCQFYMSLNGNLRNEKLQGGRTYGQTNVRKFTPMFYRTSAFWGRCPKGAGAEMQK